jgi:hypothetical protein
VEVDHAARSAPMRNGQTDLIHQISVGGKDKEEKTWWYCHIHDGEPVCFVCTLGDTSDALDGAHELCKLVGVL